MINALYFLSLYIFLILVIFNYFKVCVNFFSIRLLIKLEFSM